MMHKNFLQGMPYYLIWDGVILLRRIMKQYGWSSVSIIGHSLGALIGFMFAAIYPNEVDDLIALDAVAPTFDLHENPNPINDTARNIEK